jgi:hypothetical protein
MRRSHKPGRDDHEDELATLEEARRATISADRLKDVGDFWPGFQAVLRLEHEGKPARPAARPSWRWALGTAGLLAVVGIVILVPLLSRRGPSPRASVEGPLPFRVDSVTIEEKPAQAFIFHTQDPDITYVWVEKQL